MYTGTNGSTDLHVSVQCEQVFLLDYLRDEHVAHGQESQDHQREDHLHVGVRGESKGAAVERNWGQTSKSGSNDLFVLTGLEVAPLGTL